jgi:hypothetical protein
MSSPDTAQLRRGMLLIGIAAAIAVLPMIATATAAAAAGQVTVTFDYNCATYGFDVTNGDSVPHTVTMTVGNTPGDPVVVDPGQTEHLALATSTDPATEVTVTDSDGTVIADTIVRFCTDTENTTVTIKANTSYTLRQIAPGVAPPAPQHGTVVRAGKYMDSLRYTPNPCFSGTDSFGWHDAIAAAKGVVTVHVLSGSCKVTVRRSSTDCAARSVAYTATNPYALPVRLEVDGRNGPSDTRKFTVPAHTTRVIWHVALDPTHPQTETFTFRIAETGRVLRTDTVEFPCASTSTHGSGTTSAPDQHFGLADTGAPATMSAAIGGGGLVLLGVGLTLAGTRRRRADNSA